MSTKASFISKRVTIPSPMSVEDVRNNIVKWGQDNLYPYFLNFLYQNSAIQSGIVNAKVHYTTSAGLNYEGTDKEKFNLFFSNGNSDYNLNEIAEQMSKDLELSGMICLKGVWSLDKSKCDKLEVIDFEKVRYRLDSDDIAISNNWSDKKTTIKILEPFNPNKKDAREFYVIFQEKGKQTVNERKKVDETVYPIPGYSGGITSILTDVKINKYQLNEITNGFSTGTIVNLNNGIPPNEKEKRSIERDIQDNATGEENAGGTMVFYNNGKDNEASVMSLSGNDLKDRYIALSQDNRDNILLSHSVTTPILFGVKTEGALGNATELKVGYQIMKANYFRYRQRTILSALNYIGRNANGLQGNIIFNEVELDFLNEDKEDEITEKETQSEQINVVELFNNSGKERPNNCLYSKHLPTEFDADEEREKIIQEFQKSEFANLTAIETQVLSMLDDEHDFNTIRKTLGVNIFKLTKIYKKFRKDGLLKGTEVTTEGKKQIAKQDVSRIQVMYSYDKNPTIEGPTLLKTSRDFCVSLVGLSKTSVWSREDINLISDKIGYNAFAYRGGWYHNPKTEVNTPYCRHVWKQEIFYS